MSYDLMVFEKEVIPKNRKDFIEWFNDQTNWDKDHDYDDPTATSVTGSMLTCIMKMLWPIFMVIKGFGIVKN